MFCFYHLAQLQPPAAHGGDYAMPNPQATPSHNGFFSPQTAFYAPSSQQKIPSNQAIPGMELLSNNPVLNAGLNAVEERIKDIISKPDYILPNQVKKTFFFFIFNFQFIQFR